VQIAAETVAPSIIVTLEGEKGDSTIIEEYNAPFYLPRQELPKDKFGITR
jgi:hypothetical protein